MPSAAGAREAADSLTKPRRTVVAEHTVELAA